MITSSSLGMIPFVSSTDSTRLQMAAKQLSQSVTHPNCKRAYTIGNQYSYLSETSKLYKSVAHCNGEIIYSGHDIMIVYFDENSYLKVFETPKFKHCANGFSTKLLSQMKEGKFKKGDIVFEYDCFKDGVPSYGYNLNSAYMPWFGLNFEDAIVISESAAKLMKCNKIENIIIPIHKNSLFRTLYKDSKHGFIPEIGQKINNNVVLYQSFPKSENNKKQVYGSMNLYKDLTSPLDDNFLFNSVPLISKLPNGIVSKLKIHKIDRKNILSKKRKIIKLTDKYLEKKVKDLLKEYNIKCEESLRKVYNIFGKKYAIEILSNHFRMVKTKQEDIENESELAYIIEMEITKEYETKIGDKLSNRYANKGVVSQIIPDELRPINSKGEPIDVIISPLSVFSRMNFGQTIEGLVSKVVKHCEKEILKDNTNINFILNKLAEISNILGNQKYSNEINQLNIDICSDINVKDKFIRSIRNGGLFFEVPCFTNFDIKKLIKMCNDLFGITTNDQIKIKKETFKWVKEQLELSDIELPDKDIIYDDIYNAPIYIIKLMQLSETKINVRDFGEYGSSKKQPKQDKNNLNKASKLGNMEFDALLAANNIEVIKELRSVKSDAMNLKSEMVSQMITTGVYDLPTTKPKSYTKDIIKSFTKFLNEN